MTTEHMLVFVLVIYMIFNLYTDVKYLITKNWWHMVVLIWLIIYAILYGNVAASLLAMIGGLFVGIVFRMIFATYGAGDIKMLAVLFVGIHLITEGQWKYLLLYVLLYILFSSLQVVLLNIVKKLLKKDLQFAGYQIRVGVVEVPEAVPLFLALLTLFIL